jgi:serine phosphatase RsbU (regulator of sigma subunit)
LSSAIYLDTETPERLLTSTTPDLPISGRRSSKLVPFGDRSLLLVMSPATHQGGELLAVLPWLLLGGGVVLTAGAAGLVERLLRRRDQTERLAIENAALFEDQQRVAYTLQRSLLPESLPDVEGARLAVRYTPGVQGMEIGGDWYDALSLDGSRLVLVVGDVSGRGLRAASVMASMRFAARAFASQGDDPDVVLAKLNALAKPADDGHFATAVCVRIDLEARTATAASAGHPGPILLSGHDSRSLELTPGPPIGVRPGAIYPPLSVPLPVSGTLLLFTDGLFERRAESIDVGLERLRHTAGNADGSLEVVLDTITAELLDGGARDDVAILAVRWPS